MGVEYYENPFGVIRALIRPGEWVKPTQPTDVQDICLEEGWWEDIADRFEPRQAKDFGKPALCAFFRKWDDSHRRRHSPTEGKMRRRMRLRARRRREIEVDRLLDFDPRYI